MWRHIVNVCLKNRCWYASHKKPRILQIAKGCDILCQNSSTTLVGCDTQCEAEVHSFLINTHPSNCKDFVLLFCFVLVFVFVFCFVIFVFVFVFFLLCFCFCFLLCCFFWGEGFSSLSPLFYYYNLYRNYP